MLDGCFLKRELLLVGWFLEVFLLKWVFIDLIVLVFISYRGYRFIVDWINIFKIGFDVIFFKNKGFLFVFLLGNRY